MGQKYTIPLAAKEKKSKAKSKLGRRRKGSRPKSAAAKPKATVETLHDGKEAEAWAADISKATTAAIAAEIRAGPAYCPAVSLGKGAVVSVNFGGSEFEFAPMERQRQLIVAAEKRREQRVGTAAGEVGAPGAPRVPMPRQLSRSTSAELADAEVDFAAAMAKELPPVGAPSFVAAPAATLPPAAVIARAQLLLRLRRPAPAAVAAAYDAPSAWGSVRAALRLDSFRRRIKQRNSGRSKQLAVPQFQRKLELHAVG